MFQNLKVDIIYYKTNTDFEMEFNLCGCCRMRLLTDKTPDKKTMVHSLARAVSRSRVTIIVGNLFGEEGTISLAAGAMGNELTKADNKTYKIDSTAEIEIISGSTPLVTPEGYFGGCIIEKGPQTMILLTENKNVRKSVMKTLIHPYIEELCAIELKEKAAESFFEPEVEVTLEKTIPELQPQVEITGENEAEVLEDNLGEENITEDETEEIDEPTDETLPEDIEIQAEDEAYDYVTVDDEEEYEEDMDLVTEDDYEEIEMESIDSDLFTAEDDDYELVNSDLLFDENGISLKEFKRRNEAYYTDEDNVDGLLAEDDDDYDDDDNNFIPNGIYNIPIIFISILLFILLIVLCYTLFYVPSKSGILPTAYVKEIFDTLFG